MKLKNKYLAVIAPMTAVAAIPMILTSCGANTGANANLKNDYVCEFKPAAKKEYANSTLALNDYMEAIDPSTTNGSDFKILRDDGRYAYSQAFKTDYFKTISNLESYTLDFSEITLNKEAKKLQVTFDIKVKGTFNDVWHNGLLSFTDGNFDCHFKMEAPFDIEFCKADDTTCIKKNYIKCSLTNNTALYKLTGSCKMVSDGQIHQANKTEWTKYDIFGQLMGSDQQDGFVAYQLVINGLTCNRKVPSTYGVLYTNYMSLAEIQ